MRLFVFSLLFSLSASSFSAFLHSPWQKTTIRSHPHLLSSFPAEHQHKKSQVLTLDTAIFRDQLPTSTNDEKHQQREKAAISLPLPDGSQIEMIATETYVLAPALAKQFPGLKTYKLSGLQTSALTGRMTVSAQGVFISLHTQTGEKIFIEPIANSLINATTRTFYRSSVSNKTVSQDLPNCQLDDSHLPFSADPVEAFLQNKQYTQHGAHLYRYKIAVSATQSYMDAHGGTKAGAMAAIARTINRVNQVFERDAGIRLELVENNDRLIAPSSTPFTGSLEHMLTQNQRLIDTQIGNENYDIGHLFTAQGGGLAFVQSACRTHIKAMGVSGNLSVGSERFSLEFVAHEIAHQFAATHTFNSNQGLCTANNRHALTAYEPGSGSTIMSYIGICGSDNLQSHADAMFHIGSIAQIVEHKQNHVAHGCGSLVPASASAQALPVVDAGSDYVIPAHTPFELTGKIAGSASASLLFGWQQHDAGEASEVNTDTGNNALFRSYLPALSKRRSFPRRAVLLGTEAEKGETLPSTNRAMQFSFVVQDDQVPGTTSSDSMVVNVIASERAFRLHQPPLHYRRDSLIKVTWEVADTHLPPISCASVSLSLSTDNGLKFDQVLANNIPNSGLARITLPDSVAENTQARLKLSCDDNIFFSLSPSAFGASASGAEAGNSTETNPIDTGTKTEAGGGSLSISTYLLLMLCFIFRSKYISLRLGNTARIWINKSLTEK